MASSSIASPYGSDPSCVGMAVTSLPPYPDSVQQLSLMPYHPSSVPTVPSVGSPHGYVDYYTSPSAASQPAQSAALYLQPVAAANPEYGGGSSAIPAPAYSGYPCVQYSPLVLSPGMYSVQAPPTGRPTLVGPAPGSAYTVPPPPVVVQQSPMEPPTAVAVPPTAPQTPVQLVPVQGQLLCNVARVQPPQVTARPMVAAGKLFRLSGLVNCALYLLSGWLLPVSCSDSLVWLIVLCTYCRMHTNKSSVHTLSLELSPNSRQTAGLLIQRSEWVEFYAPPDTIQVITEAEYREAVDYC